MLVRDVMTKNVVTVEAGRTLEEAVGLMLEYGVGSVVVARDGDPTGIVTETDVLTAGYETADSFDSIGVESAMSHPLVSVSPSATVRAAVQRMREEGIKKLAVVDGIDLLGIVTQEDVVDAHPMLMREAIHHEERRGNWEAGDEPE